LKKLSVGFRKSLVEKDVQLFILDPQALEAVANDASLETYLTQVAFLRIALPNLESLGLQKLAAINGNADLLEGIAKVLDNALRQLEIPESWAKVEQDTEIPVLPANVHVNSFSAFGKIEAEPPSLLRDWEIAARGLAFKEAYGTKPASRPDCRSRHSPCT
jgi:sulfite reductase (NADPH) flavoprotein alpha-component